MNDRNGCWISSTRPFLFWKSLLQLSAYLWFKLYFLNMLRKKNDNQNKHYTWFTLASNVVLVPIPAVDYYTGVFTIPVHYIQTFYSFFCCFNMFKNNSWSCRFQSLGISFSGVRKVPSPMDVLPCHAKSQGCCENVWSRQKTTWVCLKMGYTILWGTPYPPLPQNKSKGTMMIFHGSSCF